MPGSQIATSVTILNSMKGFQGVSLTEYNTSAAAAIAAGSVVEIAGAFFTFVSDEAINASSWTAIVTGTTAYITFTPSGAAPTQAIEVRYTAAAPVWRDDFQGWYATAASNIRVIGSVYKAEAANYARKYIIDSLQQDYGRSYRWRGEVERILTGSGNWTVPAGVYKIRVTCVGGGGGGGFSGAAAGVAVIGAGGGGGTHLANANTTSINVMPGSLIAYSVGAGGAGSTTGTGASGGNTTFTGATTGTGGTGGTIGGGSAGQGVGGTGEADGSCGSVGGAVGFGGGGGLGGGNGGAGGARSNSAVNGSAGHYGGGGGGGGGVSGNGGDGGSGIIIIEY